MKKTCKQPFTSNIRKSGYLKVSRSQLKALFTGDMQQRQLAEILLCVQTFAYFSEGQVCTGEGTYVCRPGEWITTYTEIERLIGVERHQIRNRLKKLEHLGMLRVEHMGAYKRISLANYEQLVQVNRDYSAKPTVTSTEEVGTGDSIFTDAASLYSPVREQKGGGER